MPKFKVTIKVEYTEVEYCDCEYCQGCIEDYLDAQEIIEVEAEDKEGAEDLAENEVWDKYEDYEHVQTITVEVEEVEDNE